MRDNPDRLYRLDGVAHIVGVINEEELLGVLRPANQIQKFAVNCSWFQEMFGECPEGADEEIVRRYARAYIMMLLGTQLFADKSGNRIHIRWLPYVARLENMGGYSWGSASLAWLYRCMCRVANRHVVKLAGPLQLLQSWIFWRFPGFRPTGYDTFSWPLASSEKGPRVQMWRLKIDLLQAGDFIWMLYSSPDVLQEIFGETPPSNKVKQMTIHFTWLHERFRVLPVDVGKEIVSDISTDLRREGAKSGIAHISLDRLCDRDIQKVADPGPSEEYLDWWHRVAHRVLSPDAAFNDPRPMDISKEGHRRGSSQAPVRVQVMDMPDNRHVERC
ncbi:hypothetical protein Ahy_B02g057970 [Arachis hypogaea]|uniref:Aminotransferase-like plant mobile domain-containing protein n=1 Tax=Arachis hypogaea TaxID=3818 RepID=A0A445ADE9_ARAHY|nr:hypothetical protein Ahy_B02g057970 [Arachis hypogaea]